MKLFEWHIALANSLGDPIVYRQSASSKEDQLVGNVRYSAANRESYLQRAMAKIHSDALAVIADRSRTYQIRLLQTWFPTSTFSKVESATDSDNLLFLNFLMLEDALFIYSLAMRFPSFAAPLQGHLMGAIGSYQHFAGGVNVPILASDEAYKRATTRGISDGSPYSYVTTDKGRPVIYVMAQQYYEHLFTHLDSNQEGHWWEEDLWLVYEVTYLPKAPDLTKLRLDEEVLFEPRFYDDAVLKYATLYGQLDSQEIGMSDVAAQLLFKPHFTLQPDMQGAQYGNL